MHHFVYPCVILGICNSVFLLHLLDIQGAAVKYSYRDKCQCEPWQESKITHKITYFPLFFLPLNFQLHHKYVITKQESGHWFSLSGALVTYRRKINKTSAVKKIWNTAQMLD